MCFYMTIFRSLLWNYATYDLSFENCYFKCTQERKQWFFMIGSNLKKIKGGFIYVFMSTILHKWNFSCSDSLDFMQSAPGLRGLHIWLLLSFMITKTYWLVSFCFCLRSLFLLLVLGGVIPYCSYSLSSSPPTKLSSSICWAEEYLSKHYIIIKETMFCLLSRYALHHLLTIENL